MIREYPFWRKTNVSQRHRYFSDIRMLHHYSDVIMGVMASQITSLTIVYSTVYLGADQRKHQSSASLAFVRGIHLSPVNSPHKWPVTLIFFPLDNVIMQSLFPPTDSCVAADVFVDPIHIVKPMNMHIVLLCFIFFFIILPHWGRNRMVDI